MKQHQHTEPMSGFRPFHEPSHSGELYRILLAEDDTEMRKMLAWNLKKKGYQVINCLDGNDLVKKLGFWGPDEKDGIFDLIISDIRMPGVTGLEVLEMAHDREDFPPTILITAFPDEKTLSEAKQLGTKALFAKPFDVDVLIDEVMRIIPLEDAWKKMTLPSPKAKLKFPLEISFRHSSRSDPIKAFVQDMAASLNRFSSHIDHVRVVIDGIKQNAGGEHPYEIKIQINMDGAIISAKRDNKKAPGKENIYLGISLTFGKANRRLKRHIEKQYGKNNRKHISRKTMEVDYE